MLEIENGEILDQFEYEKKNNYTQIFTFITLFVTV